MAQPSSSRTGVGTTRGLRAALLQVDRDGWDSPAGTVVLAYARDRIVRPTVRRRGLRGPRADQAEATGWEVAWEVLRSLGVGVRSPWAVVTVAVWRSVCGEELAGRYCTGARTAWGLGADFPAVRLLARPDLEIEAQHEAVPASSLGPTLEAVVEAMVGVGWSRDDVEVLVDWVVARSGRARSAGPGWRTLATRSGMPPWRVRRAMALLLGDDDWPGLLARAAQDGTVVLDRPDAVAAVRSTVRSSHLSPASAVRRALVAERRAS